MVDLQGKFYMMEELDEKFVAECINSEAYKEYEGRWVKNAYDPQFTVDGKYDEAAAQAAEQVALNAHITLRELKGMIDTVVEKKLPKDLKPFAPKLSERVIVMEGYILDWDYVDRNLFLLYNDGTRVTYRDIDKKDVWKLLEREVRRFFSDGY